MTPGYQIPQTAHALADAARAHPERFARWHEESNYLIVLATESAVALSELYSRALTNPNLILVPFYEPDLGDELTAIAFLPSKETARFLANLPLAGRSRIPKNRQIEHVASNRIEDEVAA